MRKPLCLLAILTACNGGGDEADTITVNLTSSEQPARRAARNTQVKGLYMQDITVTLLDYRPGEAVQNEPTTDRPNWSVYPLVEGIEPNLLVQANGNLDLGGTMGLDRGRWTDEFRDTVGFFDVDYVGVNITRTGVLYDTAGNNTVSDYVYVGMNADGNGVDGDQPLSERYPQFSGVAGAYAEPIPPTYEQLGMNTSRFQAAHVLFADASVFPVGRVQYRVEGDGAGSAGGWVLTFDSAGAMTQDQTAVIDAYVSEILVGLGAEHIIIVPMTQTVRIALDDGLAGAQPPVDVLLSEGGWSADIGVDLTGLLNEDLSTVEDVPAIGTIYELTIPEPVQTGTYSVTIDGEDLTCDVLTVDAGLSDVTGPVASRSATTPPKSWLQAAWRACKPTACSCTQTVPSLPRPATPRWKSSASKMRRPRSYLPARTTRFPLALALGLETISVASAPLGLPSLKRTGAARTPQQPAPRRVADAQTG